MYNVRYKCLRVWCLDVSNNKMYKQVAIQSDKYILQIRSLPLASLRWCSCECAASAAVMAREVAQRLFFVLWRDVRREVIRLGDTGDVASAIYDLSEAIEFANDDDGFEQEWLLMPRRAILVPLRLYAWWTPGVLYRVLRQQWLVDLNMEAQVWLQGQRYSISRSFNGSLLAWAESTLPTAEFYMRYVVVLQVF